MLHCSLLSLGCAFGFATPHEQTFLSALRALRIAKRRLRPEVRAKLLCVSSPTTGPSLIPEAWRFIFYDAATSGSSRVVTVAARTSSEHPATVEAFSSSPGESAGGLQMIPQNKWTVDSDIALEKVKMEMKLKGVQGAQYRLIQQKAEQEPVWVIQFLDGPEKILARFRIGARTSTLSMLEERGA